MTETDDFDQILLVAIDEIIRFCLGDISAQLFFNYLEEKGVSKQAIPKNLDTFVMEFEKTVARKGQILAEAQIIEEAILKAFCAKLKLNYVPSASQYFPTQVKRIHEAYVNRKR